MFFALNGAAWAGSSSLYLSPVNTNFQLTGESSLFNDTTPIQCKIIMSGMSSAGGGKQNAGTINQVDVNGKGCNHIIFLNLPYTLSLIAKTTGNVVGVTYEGQAGHCNGSFPFTVSKRGVWTFSTSSGCGFDGSAKSAPTMTIAKS
jgi:hypothetical protein